VSAQPFDVGVLQETLDDLRERLRRTRFPTRSKARAGTTARTCPPLSGEGKGPGRERTPRAPLPMAKTERVVTGARAVSRLAWYAASSW
jgi:hypothetical protein